MNCIEYIFCFFSIPLVDKESEENNKKAIKLRGLEMKLHRIDESEELKSNIIKRSNAMEWNNK